MVHGQEALWLQEKGKHKSSNTDGEFLRGVALYTGMEGPELYGKSVENLGLYVSTQFKNGSDLMKCLLNQKVVKYEVPELSKHHTSYEKRVWEYCMGELMKTEWFLEWSLCNLFAVLLSQCASDTKSQVESMAEFPILETKLDSMGLLSMVKKLEYTGNMNNLNTKHN